MFSDGVFGGRQEALRAAFRYRQEIVALLPPPRGFHKRSTRNKTGVIGVIYDRRRGRGGPYYIATWVEADGTKARRPFSVREFGAIEAKRRAVKSRREALKRLLRPTGQHGAFRESRRY
jgi:Uma2 family endonuclease